MKGTVELQEQLESEAVDVLERKEYRNIVSAIEKERFDETAVGNSVLKIYFPPIRDKIQEYLDTEYIGHTGKTQRYIKLLCDDADALALTVLQVLLKKLSAMKNKVKVTTMTVAIMKQLKYIHKYNKVVEENPKLLAYLGSEYKRASAKRKKMLIEKHLQSFEDAFDTKMNTMEAKAGATLIDLVMHSNTDLIEKKHLWNKRRERYATFYLMFTEQVLDIIMNSNYIHPSLALFPPMVVPPTDWTSFKEGGYLTISHSFVKIKSKASRERLKGQDFSKSMVAINKLQKVGWKVNKRVADIIYDMYEANMVDPRSPPTLPRIYGDIPTSTPTKVEDLIDGFGNYPENPTKEEKKIWAEWNRKREHIKIGLDAENGRRLQYLMTMGVVDKMIDYDRFYYVYQLDYRGRVYPITDFFNPQSKGYVKAMIEFADGHLLDDKGIYWLKIHSANTYGLDKEEFPDRVTWAEENRTQMLEAARDPMGTISYWTRADSPYEFLAACMALQDHVEGKLVYLPIQLDAVNSGIQMYSGLLRDKKGAQSTCVIGNDRSDLYAEVADKVEQKLTIGKYPPYISFIDKEGVEKVVTTRIEADSMKGNFTRSMTKKNVMTVPYSVSMRGMKMQNWDVMNDMKVSGKAFWEGDEWVVNYLWTTLTHEAIFDIVKGARAGQEYLKEVAGKLKEPALWHTPLYDLPVLQMSLKEKVYRVQTVLGTLSIVERTDDVNKQKQLASIAANYIHSIDATILMYVIDNIGYDIGTIHDCFLVHPNQGERVRDMYKEGYVKVMRADPLKMFSQELDKESVVEIPYVGDLDLDEVYDSEYIIS